VCAAVKEIALIGARFSNRMMNHALALLAILFVVVVIGGFEVDATLQTLSGLMHTSDEKKGHWLRTKAEDEPKFSLPGAGFLGSAYTLGAVTALAELGLITPESDLYASSSGSLIAGTVCAGIKLDDFKRIAKKTVTYCATQLDQCIGRILLAGLPDFEELFRFGTTDEYIRKHCKNTHFGTTISTGTCNATSFGSTGKPFYLSNLETKIDIFNAAQASSWIPGITAPTCFKEVDGEKLIDGGFSTNSFCFAEKCVKIYPYFNSSIPNVDIFPGVRGNLNGWPYSPAIWKIASFSALISAPNFDIIFEYGVADAQYWHKNIYKKWGR